MEILLLQFRYFQLKKYFPVFWKRLRFSENLFKSQRIENIQNFQWLSHKSKPISQIQGYFENPSNWFIEAPMLFLLVLKWNLWEKAFSSVTTKTNSDFAEKVAEMSNRSFSVDLINHLSQISVLFNMEQWII